MSEVRPPAGGVDPETNQVTPPVPGPYAPTEPILSTATVVTVVTAVMALLVALGLPIDDDLQTAILGAIAVIAPVVLGIIARQKAWAPATVRATVQAEVAKARRTEPPNGGVW